MENLQPTEGRRSRVLISVPLLILLVTLAADQVTKGLVDLNMSPGQSVPDSGFFRFTYVTNTGMAFGLFPSQTLLPALASFVGIMALLAFYRTRAISDPHLKISLGLQMGGAIGNLVDRIRLGHVIDFLDVGSWPVFNVADSAIMVGLTVLLWSVAFDRGRPTDEKEPGEAVALAPAASGEDFFFSPEWEWSPVAEDTTAVRREDPWEKSEE